ncbi:MAG: hypothetical protein LBC96_05435 [Lachnospiraceae bacterium]|jgi:hypothetical protein|nr:hypothetical protein [Lachnospiraceae bacterium]
MGVNGVTGAAAGSAYAYQASKPKNETKTQEKKDNTASQSGVIYEPSKKASDESKKTEKFRPDAETVARLKAETENQKAQLLEMVRKMLAGQGQAHDIWAALREGTLNVDAATREKAMRDIADDGFWGVNQTSQRILDFAVALTGGDPKKIDEMRAAFEKGFKMAEKTWGGKLPDISQRTREAVLAGFDRMKEEAELKKG